MASVQYYFEKPVALSSFGPNFGPYTGLISNVTACEKRIEEMVSDGREIMPLFVVVHVDCKKVNGIAV